LKLRPAISNDVPVLRTMLQKLSEHDGGNYPVGSEASLRAGGFGPRPLFQAIIAEDHRPMGMAIYYPDFSTHRGEPGLYIQDIWVEPAARGHGLGRKLMAAALRQQDWGARYVVLGVSPDNMTASGFYERLGFTRRGYEMMILTGAAVQALG
jgi:ribosomal protein S18 acetylase RimI-like enzyme